MLCVVSGSARLIVILVLYLAFLNIQSAYCAQAPVVTLQTAVKQSDLDPTAFQTCIAGSVEAVKDPGSGKELRPEELLWTAQGPQRNWAGVMSFCPGRSTATRHLRLGFQQPVQVGSVLATGNCRVSVLKPDAPYPGNMEDESQWISAAVLQTEKEQAAYAPPHSGCYLWTLPSVSATRAIRFTHVPDPADAKYDGSIGGVYLLAERYANMAPQAQVLASVNDRKASALVDQRSGDWKGWDNADELRPPALVSENAPWLVLNWPQAVTLSGLCAVFGGFSAAEVQTYIGPEDRHPRESSEGEWKTLRKFDGLRCWYPLRLPVQWLDFGETVTTRALRIRLLSTIDKKNDGHPHVANRDQSGHVVWVDELLALRPLENAALASAVLSTPGATNTHPPIPVRFHLPRAGYVTLVIEDQAGKRMRNLISETSFPAGENIAWWDGRDDLGRDPDAYAHGLYHIPGKPVPPGSYHVRGLWRQGINLLYEFPVYTAGSPAWNTADRTGAWLSNHSAPRCALFVPAEKSPCAEDTIFLGSHVSEGTHGLAWVNLEGRKLGGMVWVGGNWTGAEALARDSGPQAKAGIILYVASGFEDELRLTALHKRMGNGAQAREPEPKAVLKLAIPKSPTRGAIHAGGLAAWNNLLVCSLPNQNLLVVADAIKGSEVARYDLPAPHGVAFDHQGKLLVLSNKRLLRYTLAAAPGKDLPNAETIISSGLDAPFDITLDQNDNIYISDRGISHQIKKYTANGKPMRICGQAGAPAAGRYNPLHMNNPAGMASDSRGNLWVAEEDDFPKRISVWNSEGKLVKALYGPAQYGGGGKLDPRDKSFFFYNGMRFHLDWEKGTNTLEAVYWRPETGAKVLPDGWGSTGYPQDPLYQNKVRYFSNSYNSNPTSGAPIATIWIEREDKAYPVAAAGRAANWSLLCTDAFRSLWPEKVDLAKKNWDNQAFCLWSDLNDDRMPQPNEVRMIAGKSGGVVVQPDLSLVVSRLNDTAVRFPLTGYTPGGAPLYDFDRPEILAQKVQGPASSGGEQALVDASGWTVLTSVPQPFSALSVAGVYKGEPRWSYPNPWPGLHASHNAPVPEQPGQLIGTTRMLGGLIDPTGSEAGPLWCVNGNMGPMYLMTVDGLFVATLFQDVRQGKPWSMPQAERGGNINDLSPHDENFWPSITQTSDGKVYLVDGARTSLVRVDGLQSLRRLPPATITVTAEDLIKTQSWLDQREAGRQASAGRKSLKVTRATGAPQLNDFTTWTNAEWIEIDRRGTAANFNSNNKEYQVSGAIMIAADRLYIAYRTPDKHLWKNAGDAPEALFKTGGGLDFMLATDAAAAPGRVDAVAGDLRLTVAQVNGKPRALLYRPVVPGTAADKRVPFSSPWRTIWFDSVQDVSAQVQTAENKEGYAFSVPLATLGWNPESGKRYGGDLGLLRGDGHETTQRVYWSNKATGITSDVPSEAQLAPKFWGTLVCE